MMKSTKKISHRAEATGTSRLEAALTGRRDACPTDEAHRLTAGFHSRDHLPHLKKEGASYFVTFRLAGTLPASVLQKLKLERAEILQQALAAKRPVTWQEQQELFRWYSRRVDAWLDAGHGECFLRQPNVAKIVADTLKFFDGRRYEHGW
jgi:putative transposase